ncbi:hypothetical protein LWC05_08975 [Acetobacter sicerae]|uniref:EF-hand domain-containing protein n=1 Tax=Acetobacter sicerae TaxID=85325 RepID=A0ABS8VV22_9PROT|nr:hypothetical protein [Acetobacter sicerae]MCE0744011.1 hypothetical protein [Acetobacter sicerae]
MIVKKSILVLAVALLSFPITASAHRLDEYLQATTIGLSDHSITLHLRLTPGVDVADSVIRQIDQNGDGDLSIAEQQAYVSHVEQTLAFSVNGQPLPLSAETMTFPSLPAMKSGAGTIDIQFITKMDFKKGDYTLAYNNRGAGPDTVWLVNSLTPKIPDICIIQQKRSENQSHYELHFLTGEPCK